MLWKKLEVNMLNLSPETLQAIKRDLTNDPLACRAHVTTHTKIDEELRERPHRAERHAEILRQALRGGESAA
jgi:anti-sigma factor RsiW